MRHALLAVLAIAAACGASVATDAPGGAHTSPQGTGGPSSPSLASCGTSKTLFTDSPVPDADLLGWVPLGQLAPPGHLFPTDHQYLYINDPGKPSTVRQVSVVSPGDITITLAHRSHYSSNGTDDYAFIFWPCDEVRAEFGHVTTIVPALLAQLGTFDQQCDSYAPTPLLTVSNCYTKAVAVKLHAGDPIGTVGGQGTSFALDFSLFDRRTSPTLFANAARWGPDVAPDHLHVAPASDYFSEPARSFIRTKLGNFNGTEHRTTEPVGGTIGYDVPGTLQGVWVNSAQPLYPETAHLAIVPDNIDPSRISVSMGTSQPGFFAGLYQVAPRATGVVNRHPAQVTADGNIYCYEFAASLGMLLVRLDDASTVRVEGRNGNTTCADQLPWTFTASSFVYKR